LSDPAIDAADVPADAAIDDPADPDVAVAPDTADTADVVDAPDSPELPAVYTREGKGEPVDAAYTADLTDRYLAMLAATRHFENLEERLHGWPESEPSGYWYGTWWSGLTVTKKDGRVTFVHSPDGADNNGMRTAPMLDGACFARALWGGDAYAHLVRKVVRGFVSWVLAMESPSHPDVGVLMTRASYPAPVASTDGGRDLFIDYSADRPGIDDDPSAYVHNPDNPWWGDTWVKNKRSKDDIGHMLLTIALLPACAADADEGLKADLAQLEALYGAWCRRVEDDGWYIATIDPDWNVFWPQEDLAFFQGFANVECKSMLAVRLAGRGDEGPLACGNGLSDLDEMEGIKNDFHQINRSFHEAAAAHAFLRGRTATAFAMLDGLAWRVEHVLDGKESATPPEQPNDSDAAELLISSANAGLPLTWREARWLQARVEDAIASHGARAGAPELDLWNPATPDGTYPYDVDGGGIAHRYLGALLGQCASPWRNPTSKPVLDCDRVKAWKPQR
jgi:hypothetical protein